MVVFAVELCIIDYVESKSSVYTHFGWPWKHNIFEIIIIRVNHVGNISFFR